MRKTGTFPEKKEKKAYTSKPYDLMDYPGQRVSLPEGVFDMTTAIHGIYEE